MDKNIYVNSIIEKRILLKPEFINKKLEANIENTLRNEIGDKCIKEGFIDKKSIKIIKRSKAIVMRNDFSGDLAIDIIFSANICNPVRGNIITCEIKRINKLGLQAEVSPLSIIVAKQYHDNKEIFKDLKVGQKIDIVVIAKRFSLHDNVIEVVGKIVEKGSKVDYSKKKIKVKNEKIEVIGENSDENSDEEKDLLDSDVEISDGEENAGNESVDAEEDAGNESENESEEDAGSESENESEDAGSESEDAGSESGDEGKEDAKGDGGEEGGEEEGGEEEEEELEEEEDDEVEDVDEGDEY